MADGHHSGALGDVYGAKSTDEVAALYDRWADTYDSEMAVAGYRHPSICLALLARHLPRGAAPVLDAGCGTGLVGAEGLDELVRICRPGGVIVLTVKNTLWQDGFAARIAELEAAGAVARAEETEPYVSMPGETGTVPSRAVVLRRT